MSRGAGRGWSPPLGGVRFLSLCGASPGDAEDNVWAGVWQLGKHNRTTHTAWFIRVRASLLARSTSTPAAGCDGRFVLLEGRSEEVMEGKRRFARDDG